MAKQAEERLGYLRLVADGLVIGLRGLQDAEHEMTAIDKTIAGLEEGDSWREERLLANQELAVSGMLRQVDRLLFELGQIEEFLRSNYSVVKEQQSEQGSNSTGRRSVWERGKGERGTPHR